MIWRYLAGEEALDIDDDDRAVALVSLEAIDSALGDEALDGAH